MNGEAPSAISCLTVNASFGLLAYGNGSGLVIVDFIQVPTIWVGITPNVISKDSVEEVLEHLKVRFVCFELFSNVTYPTEQTKLVGFTYF